MALQASGEIKFEQNQHDHGRMQSARSNEIVNLGGNRAEQIDDTVSVGFVWGIERRELHFGSQEAGPVGHRLIDKRRQSLDHILRTCGDGGTILEQVVRAFGPWIEGRSRNGEDLSPQFAG